MVLVDRNGEAEANPVDAHVAFSSYSLSLMLASSVGGSMGASGISKGSHKTRLQ